MIANWKGRLRAFNRRQALFAATLLAVLAVNTVPALRASALYLIKDGETITAVQNGVEVTADRVIVVGAEEGDAELRLEGGHKVTAMRGEEKQYATTRGGETVTALLHRMGLTVGEMELVKVDVSQPEITIEIDTHFTYYETATETAPHATIYTETYQIPKGETQVVQSGIDGTRDVVYEVVYADGQLVSRQAVAEDNNTSVTELAYIGTLVKEAQEGDRIASVITESDGSGYLVMTSGDALHFSKKLDVRCTAYTTGYGGVGTRTATGTTVRRGCVAVDKNVIPLGTAMYVATSGTAYGMARAEDTGVRGAKLDLYMNSYSECIQFGVRNAVAYILD